VLGLKGFRLILLATIATLIGVCIGKAPDLGPGNSWVAYLYLAASLAIVTTIVEVCDRSGSQQPAKAEETPAPPDSTSLPNEMEFSSANVRITLKR